MGKRKKERVIKCGCGGISESRMIDMQAEAYYRALKKIEQEKLNYEEQAVEKKSDNGIMDLLFILNVMFFPWIIHKRFRVNKQIYDSILVLFVSGVLKIIGSLAWLSGIILVIVQIYQIIGANIVSTITVFINGVSLILLGSILVLSGTQFYKEEDSNKIYAYSGSIIALISCVVSIIVLITTK